MDHLAHALTCAALATALTGCNVTHTDVVLNFSASPSTLGVGESAEAVITGHVSAPPESVLVLHLAYETDAWSDAPLTFEWQSSSPADDVEVDTSYRIDNISDVLFIGLSERDTDVDVRFRVTCNTAFDGVVWASWGLTDSDGQLYDDQRDAWAVESDHRDLPTPHALWDIPFRCQ